MKEFKAFEPPPPPPVNLESFTNTYAIAGDKNFTDLFTTREIQQMISDHCGLHYEADEINRKLTELGYMFIHKDKRPMWMVKEKSDSDRTVLLLENGGK